MFVQPWKKVQRRISKNNVRFLVKYKMMNTLSYSMRERDKKQPASMLAEDAQVSSQMKF